jgi:monofunctional biosynthetic peptidoglycan transglycosylase
VDERGQDREWEGGDEPTTRTVEPTREAPIAEHRTESSEPAAAVPPGLWPRAAGGGAGGVSAPVLLEAARPVDELATEPERVPAEAATEPPQPDIVRFDEPASPPQPGNPVETGLQQADDIHERAPDAHVSETTEPAPQTMQSLPPAVDALAGSSPPALWRYQAELDPLPAAPSMPPPQQSPVSAQTLAAIATPWPETPVRPAPSAVVEAPRYLRRALRLVAAGLLALAGLVLALVLLYRWVDPPASTLMLGQRLLGTPITQRWVPLARISPNLQLAAILSEDARFCRHSGVDWGELKEAIESAGDGVARGGSTISMQVVKNLFLWPSKSYLRKAVEIPLAYLIEAAWSKPRILEIYLNIAEWGPGVFGAEAAARHHFGKPASLLSPREAALLAVTLPNPFDRDAASPGPGTQRLADNLLLRMRAAQGNSSCVRSRPANAIGWGR